MLKSMTAYGRACVSDSFGRYTVEIQSVNRRHLETAVYLSKELARFDPEIKQWIAASISRGQITVKIAVSFDRESPLIVRPNLPLIRQLRTAWSQIADELDIKSENRLSLSLFAKEEGVLIYDEDLKEESVVKESLKKTVEMALKQCNEMKQREGAVILEDIMKRIDTMRKAMDQIFLKAPGATDRYRQKLRERLEEVLPGLVENEDKILREIAVYAEKVDITEEIIRFNSHLDQFTDLLKKGAESGVGKTAEFLLQELLREANTIGSKASDAAVTRHIIEIKSEQEKIREQIQNVE